MEELSDIYQLEKINLTINTEKWQIFSDEPMDAIKDNYNGQIIIAQKKENI